MSRFYTCPYHLDAGGYDARRGCGGWAPGGPNDGRLCTEAEEADCVRRLHGVGRDIYALTNYVGHLAVTRRELILTLISQYGWSQREIAEELGISQPRVSDITKPKTKKEGT